MSKSIYEWYFHTKTLIDEAKEEKEQDTFLLKSLEETLKLIEGSCPGIKEGYERNKKIQKSFTSEQIDFICFQIGEWYFKWKERLVTGCNPGEHRLGFAKEELKTMICGDR